MTRLFVLLASCVAFVDSLNNLLVQGRADTLKVLRKIIRERDAKVVPFDPFANPQVAWDVPLPRDLHSREFHGAMKKQLSKGTANPDDTEPKNSGQCLPIDQIDCNQHNTNEITCLFTNGGSTCCVCTAVIREKM